MGHQQEQQSPPNYIVQNGHVYYQGPPLGAGPGYQPGRKDDIPPPAYPVETRESYVQNPYVQPQTVVVQRESRAPPFAAGLAVGCCIAACCTVM